eukprot:2567214-Rhodomonas_salina.1
MLRSTLRKWGSLTSPCITSVLHYILTSFTETAYTSATKRNTVIAISSIVEVITELRCGPPWK